MTAQRKQNSDWNTKEIVIIGDSSIHPASHSLVGAAAVADAFSTVQAQVSLVSVIGEDPYGDEIISRLEKHPLLNLDGLIQVPYYPTTQFSAFPEYAQTSHRKHIPLDVEQQVITHFTNHAGYADSMFVVDYNFLLTPAIRTWIQEYLKKPDAITGVISSNPVWYAASKPTLAVLTYNQAAALLRLPRPSSAAAVTGQLNDQRRNLLQTLHAHEVLVTHNSGIFIASPRTSYHHPFDSAVSPSEALQNTTLTAAVVALSHTAKTTLITGMKAIVRTAASYWNSGSADSRSSVAPGSSKHIPNRILLQQLVVRQKQAGQRIVLTTGYFDVLRPNHLHYLEEARAFGDILIVAVKTDDTLDKQRGPTRRLMNALDDRIKMLAGLQSVDYLFSFSDTTAEELVKTIKPDVYVKGGNYLAERLPETGWVRLYGGQVKIIPLPLTPSPAAQPPSPLEHGYAHQDYSYKTHDHD